MSILVRSVQLNDLEALWEMTRSVTPGLTTLLVDRPRLLERVERSHFAFTRKSESHAGEPYVLVMQDLATKRLIGTSTVYGKTGGYEPFYAYRVVTTTHHSRQLAVHHQQRMSLHLQRIYDGPTEIGSLFLLPECRGAGRGRLLSLARFALIAQRPHRFGERVIAEMRGRCDEHGVSPFWEAVMRPFFGVDFPVADALSTVSKPFIEELMPQYPLHLDLMPQAARDVIGKVHPETEAAVRLLASEGFRCTDLVDIFDAGPVMECDTLAIDAVRRCRIVRVQQVQSSVSGVPVILASKLGGFAATFTEVMVVDSGASICISQEAALALALEPGCEAWLMPQKPAVDPPGQSSGLLQRGRSM